MEICMTKADEQNDGISKETVYITQGYKDFTENGYYTPLTTIEEFFNDPTGYEDKFT